MPTLKDVAAETGLTVTTVSRVLNNRGYISAETRQKVADAIKKLNYHPNEMARSLKNKRTNTIGLIVPHIRHGYFASVISEIEKNARERGYRILLCNSQNDEKQIIDYYQMCVENRVAGVILCSGRINPSIFSDTDIPLITFERFLENGIASVECDNIQGGRLAAKHFLEKGVKHPLVAGTREGNYEMPADSREDSFRQTYEEAGIPVNVVPLDISLFNRMSYRGALREAFRKYPETDGFFAGSDLVAAQALQVCSEFGIRVPEDMKVIGFDGIDLASYSVPTLTTVKQPVEEMAKLAVSLLLDAVDKKMVPKRTILPVTLVEGGSTK